MKYITAVMSFILFLGGCKQPQKVSDADLDPYAIDYHLEDNRYAVVIVEDDGISHKTARQYALQRAAAVAQDNGYRYFVIEDENQVVVFKGGAVPQGTPRNIYYSLIQSGDFGKDRLESQTETPVEQKPAYQIRFSCYKEKTGHAIDVCTFKPCAILPGS